MKNSLQRSKGSSYGFRGCQIRLKELPNLVLQLVLPPSLPPSFCPGLFYLPSLVKRLPHSSSSTRIFFRFRGRIPNLVNAVKEAGSGMPTYISKVCLSDLSGAAQKDYTDHQFDPEASRPVDWLYDTLPVPGRGSPT